MVAEALLVLSCIRSSFKKGLALDLHHDSSQFQFADQDDDLSGNSCRKLHWRVVFSTIS